MFQHFKSHGINLEQTPVVLQYNKRDLDNIITVDEMETALNKEGFDAFPSIALQGKGVIEPFVLLINWYLKRCLPDIDYFSPIRFKIGT